MKKSKLPSFTQAMELMNGKLAMIRVPTTIYDTEHEHRMSLQDFQLWYGKLRYSDKEGNAKQLVRVWPASPDRREYDRLVYDPSEKAPKTDWNMFHGWGVEPKKGDITPWVELLDHLYGVGTSERRFAEQWDGYPIRHPATKLRTARIVTSLYHGAGKGAEAYLLERIYGPHNVSGDITDQHLDSQFNTYLENKQLIVVPECLMSGDSKRNLANRIKNLVTAPNITIEDKFKSRYPLDPFVANFLLHSNHPDAMKLEDRDRRFHVASVIKSNLSGEFFEKYFKWADSKEGPAALRYHFDHLDYTGFNPFAAAPMTDAKVEMTEATATPLENWARALVTSPEEFVGKRTVATLDELMLVAYKELDDTSRRYLDTTRLTVALKHAGLAKIKPSDQPKTGANQIRINGSKKTFWVVSGPRLEFTLKELRAVYEKEAKVTPIGAEAKERKF